MNKKELIKKYETLYSEELGIDLKKREQEWFKWFLAAILFGKPIREEQAMNTYRLFALKKVTTPNAILKTGWDGLVEILDLGGYVRYDFSTATKLLNIMKLLEEKYKGKLSNIHKAATNAKDLEKKLLEFKGIGPTTVNIFLRELRYVWEKADPEPLPIVKKLAKKYNINLNKIKRKSKKFVKIEAALIRLRKTK